MTSQISVIVASYNYAHFLGDTLNSILNQSWTNFEVIVIDDGSSDNSVAVASKFAAIDSRIRVFRHPDGKNHGLAVTLQRGLSLAHGEFIAFLESDDLWEPDCLAYRMEAISKKHADVVFNNVKPLPMPGADTDWFNSYIPRIMTEHIQRASAVKGKYAAYSLRRAFLIENKIPTFSCIMIRREILASLSFASPVPRWLDWWLWAQVAEQAKFVYLKQKLTCWRIHADSYNHKISIARYLKDGASIWKGFRGLLYKRYRDAGDLTAALFLLCPFFLRLFIRFMMLSKQCGVIECSRCIAKRIHR